MAESGNTATLELTSEDEHHPIKAGISSRDRKGVGGFNLSLIMRQRFGKGRPRGWQGISGRHCLGSLSNCDASTNKSSALRILSTFF